jgi:hypothetical protein
MSGSPTSPTLVPYPSKKAFNFPFRHLLQYVPRLLAHLGFQGPTPAPMESPKRTDLHLGLAESTYDLTAMAVTGPFQAFRQDELQARCRPYSCHFTGAYPRSHLRAAVEGPVFKWRNVGGLTDGTP